MSIERTRAASDAAIPFKTAMEVVSSLFHRSYSATGCDLSNYWAQDYFNSTIYQMSVANWAPFPTRRREGEGMGLNIEFRA